MQFFLTKRGIAAVFIVAAVLTITVFIIQRATPEPEIPVVDTDPKITVIGHSVQNREIESFTFGNGETNLLFVGGIHGGYEWNSVLLAYEFLDHLNLNQESIPDNLTVSVIPSLNPDGVYKIIGKEGRFVLADVSKNIAIEPGRFNAHNVDLNRNFDCNWQSESMWRGNKVSAGTAVFSEPEARAFRDYVLEVKPDAVVFWHSQAGAVYTSACNNGVLKETETIANAYAKASGYISAGLFDAYKVTGDAEGWLAKINIPSITVELTTHETIEWEKNLAGTKALFEYYRTKAL